MRVIQASNLTIMSVEDAVAARNGLEPSDSNKELSLQRLGEIDCAITNLKSQLEQYEAERQHLLKTIQS